MGKGMTAGRLSKKEKTVKRLKEKIRDADRKQFIEAVMAEVEDQMSAKISYHHNIDMIGVMFALRDEFGFGRGRLIRAIRKSCDHATRMMIDHADVDEMLMILREETGLTEEDMTWNVEIEI